MQLRISPGGRMRFSRRIRPELPPSSVTVTMAVRSLTGLCRSAGSSRRRVTYSFSPRKRVDSPVPPPNATTLRPRNLRFELEVRFFTANGAWCSKTRIQSRHRRGAERRPIMPGKSPRFESASRAVFLGIKQFSETRVFLKEREVLVIPCMIAIFRTELDGDFQVFHCGIGLAGEAIKRCESVVNVVGFRSRLARFIEAFPSVVPSANIHHGHTAP